MELKKARYYLKGFPEGYTVKMLQEVNKIDY